MKRIPSPRLLAALLATLPALAAAQSNVTLYGLVDSGITWVDNGVAGSGFKQQSGVSQGSRWGVVGSEDLGGGTKANVVLEAGFFNDTGVSTGAGGFSRRSIVGLSGKWGALDVGRDYNPVHTLLAQFDPLSNGLLSAASGFMGNAGAQMPNAMFYATPNVDGWAGKIGYSLGERTPAGRSGDTPSSRVTYERDRLAAGLAYAYQNVAAATTAASTAANLTAYTRDHQLLLTLSYKFDRIVPVVMVEQGKNKSGSLTYNSNNGVPFSADFRTTMLGVTVPFTGHKFAASWQHYNDRTAADADASNLALAWYTFLSRRTTLYANVSKIVNRNGQRFAFVDAGKNVFGYTPPAGQTINPLGMVVGIQHKF